MDDQEFTVNFDCVFLKCFFCNIIKVNNFFVLSFILLHLVFSFLHIKSFFILYAYVSTEKVDCNLLPSFELKAISLISTVKILCFSLLNLCCVFNINLLFFMNSSWFYLGLSILAIFFSSWFLLFLKLT